ncbi:uncharacterized protein LOC143151373 isoform X1 [Ptiloglossa arizonensis]|uniref:uncharacterized protein LOC143151373 isoform X1 n=1 Tax=Ptiloglossa arizonensis TaxID=3350558 RepID=UPI003FA109DE
MEAQYRKNEKNCCKNFNKSLTCESYTNQNYSLELNTQKTKQIEVKYSYVYNLVKDKIVNVKYCPTKEQPEYILRKSLKHIKFKKLKGHSVNNLNERIFIR